MTCRLIKDGRSRSVPSMEAGPTKLNITITIQDKENQGKVVGDGHPEKSVMPQDLNEQGSILFPEPNRKMK